MGGNKKIFKIFYWPKKHAEGENGTRVTLISASNKAEANSKFQRQYAGEFLTIDRIEE